MKQPKKLTRTQKEILSKQGLNAKDWGLATENENSLMIVNRKTKEVRIIEK